MPLKQTAVYSFILLLIISSCSKKHLPQTSGTETHAIIPDSASAKKPIVKRTAAPKVIVVNDKVAKKSVDGRLYYDLDGHRYWKNYKDGKYYLFSQSMYTDKAFQPPSN